MDNENWGCLHGFRCSLEETEKCTEELKGSAESSLRTPALASSTPDCINVFTSITFSLFIFVQGSKKTFLFSRAWAAWKSYQFSGSNENKTSSPHLPDVWPAVWWQQLEHTLQALAALLCSSIGGKRQEGMVFFLQFSAWLVILHWLSPWTLSIWPSLTLQCHENWHI